MQSPGTPRVSVLMTTYNTGELVRETVDAILAQTFDDWELVIVDDCSADDTFDIVSGYDDPRIRAYRNDANQGISRSRNRAISLARGDYIAASDHDDISLPQRLQRQVEYLDAHPEVALLATAAKELKNGRLRSRYHGEMRSHILAWRLFTRCSIVHSSACFRRDLIERHNIRYRPEYHYAEDFVLFNEIAAHGDIQVLPEELVIYRVTGDNASTRHHDAMTDNGIRYLQELYRARLGMEVADDEARLLWWLFGINSVTDTVDRLNTTGQLYAQGLRKFLESRHYDEQQTAEIREFACRDWWRVVGNFCNFHGRVDAMQLYRGIPELSGWQPGHMERLARSLKSLIRKALRA